MHSKMLAMLEPKDAAQESIMDAVRALSGDTKREAEATLQPVGQMTVASALDFLLDELEEMGLTLRITAICSTCDNREVEVDPCDVIEADLRGEDMGRSYCNGGPSCRP